MKAIGVDDSGLPQSGDPLAWVGEVTMNMAVDEIAGAILPDQLSIADKTLMTAVFGIVDMARRGMGQYHIELTRAPELKP